MKTVMIYDDTCDVLRFAVLDGDYSHLDRVYINTADIDEALQEELSALVFNQTTWQEQLDFKTEFPVEEARNGAKVIVAGFLA